MGWRAALVRRRRPEQELRAKVEAVGGHATLYRGHADRVFHPLNPAMSALHSRIKHILIPKRCLMALSSGFNHADQYCSMRIHRKDSKPIRFYVSAYTAVSVRPPATYQLLGDGSAVPVVRCLIKQMLKVRKSPKRPQSPGSLFDVPSARPPPSGVEYGKLVKILVVIWSKKCPVALSNV